MAPGFGGLSGLAGVGGGYLDAQKEIEDTELTRQRQKLAQQDIDLGPLRKQELQQRVTQAGQQYQLGQAIDTGYGRTLQLFNAPVPGAQPMTPMPGQPSQPGPPGMPPGAGPPGGPPMGASVPPQPGPQPGGGPPGGMISPGGMGGGFNARFAGEPFPGPVGNVGGAPTGGMVQAPQSAPPGGGMPPGMRPGGQQPQPLTWQQVAQMAVRANPGAPPEVIGGIVDRFKTIMAGESREQWEQVRLQLEYMRGQTSRDVAGTRAGATTQAAETRADAARDVARIRAENDLLKIDRTADRKMTQAEFDRATKMMIEEGKDARTAAHDARVSERAEKHDVAVGERAEKHDVAVGERAEKHDVAVGERAAGAEASRERIAHERAETELLKVEKQAGYRMTQAEFDRATKLMLDEGKDARAAAAEASRERLLQERGRQRLEEIDKQDQARMDRLEFSTNAKADMKRLDRQQRQELFDAAEENKLSRKQIDATLRIMHEQGLDARTAARLATQKEIAGERADVMREGQERRAETATAGRMTTERGQDIRAGTASAALKQRGEQFQQREARLQASQEMRADDKIQKMELQKRALEERIRHDRTNEDFKAYGQLLDNYKTRIRATLQASNAFNMLKPAEKKALLDEMDQEVEQARTRMRNFMQGRGPAPTSTPQVQPRGEQEGAAQPAPQPGDVRSGYRFKGGDPNKQESWERVQ